MAEAGAYSKRWRGRCVSLDRVKVSINIDVPVWVFLKSRERGLCKIILSDGLLLRAVPTLPQWPAGTRLLQQRRCRVRWSDCRNHGPSLDKHDSPWPSGLAWRPVIIGELRCWLVAWRCGHGVVHRGRQLVMRRTSRRGPAGANPSPIRQCYLFPHPSVREIKNRAGTLYIGIRPIGRESVTFRHS